MIEYNKYKLANGLTVILHQDNSTPLVAVNVLYNVGSKDEEENKTGFAHLFEHLMFGGSVNVPDFDTPIQDAGGDNNAFTNSDITNFYNILPAENLEVALWLESDRMLQLDFNQDGLDIQKRVVIEEFKETSINKPYGNLWHHLSGLAYQKHPYRWPTIGLTPDHIERAAMDDVVTFFNNHYMPSNAILVISGKFSLTHTKTLVEKWFGDIPDKSYLPASLPTEPMQDKFRQEVLTDKVPAEALYLAFHMPSRTHKDFAGFDILTDVLNGGRSARFYQNLVKNSGVFSYADAYISATSDPGLCIMEGKLINKGGLDEGRALIWNELEKLKTKKISNEELRKVKNALISSVEYSEVNIIHKAMNLAYFESLGDAHMINQQVEEYERITSEDIQRIANSCFREQNCSEVIYATQNEA